MDRLEVVIESKIYQKMVRKMTHKHDKNQENFNTEFSAISKEYKEFFDDMIDGKINLKTVITDAKSLDITQKNIIFTLHNRAL